MSKKDFDVSSIISCDNKDYVDLPADNFRIIKIDKRTGWYVVMGSFETKAKAQKCIDENYSYPSKKYKYEIRKTEDVL